MQDKTDQAVKVMSKLTVAALIVIATVLVALPVQANHSHEPNAPLADVELVVLQYPHIDEPLQLCDGSEVVDWTNIRVIANAYPTQTPSEHFTVDYRVLSDRGGEFRWPVTEWSDQWRHQNVPAHAPYYRIIQSGIWQSNSGEYSVELRVKGMETGVEFVRTCSWQVSR